MSAEKKKVAFTIVKAPRHTLKDFSKSLKAMLERCPDIENAVILEASVDTDPKSIYDGAVDLILYRPDLEETGTLTIPVMRANCVS